MKPVFRTMLVAVFLAIIMSHGVAMGQTAPKVSAAGVQDLKLELETVWVIPLKTAEGDYPVLVRLTSTSPVPVLLPSGTMDKKVLFARIWTAGSPAEGTLVKAEQASFSCSSCSYAEETRSLSVDAGASLRLDLVFRAATTQPQKLQVVYQGKDLKEIPIGARHNWEGTASSPK